MSIKLVEYIPCSKCAYTLIGKIETRLRVAQVGRITVFKVTTIWLCLRCQHTQDIRVDIREIRENWVDVRYRAAIQNRKTLWDTYLWWMVHREKTKQTCCWVEFGVALIENITNYICKSCRYVLIQVVEHKEEKI